MPLGPGTKLGRYEIRALIGAGGMGEVYQAVDTGLKRNVAIKVLPAEFTSDGERLRRFQQEALATASLNHPHIVAVHDVGTHEGTTFVVSELLEGRTLKDIMAAGPVSPRKAADYATQIASGLAAAHEKGIVHRDLKPANLFVTKDERVKILDFGLARVMDGSAGGGDGATATVTMPGTILGTVGYMSPEQVRGEAVDHRADIFAFGVILYELLSGRRAFQRESVPGTLAAILHDEPPTWTGDGSSLSLRLLRLGHRCLEKSPAARFQSARDLMLVLSDEASDPSMAPPPPAARRRGTLITGALAGGVAGTVFGLWLGSLAGPQVSGTPADAPPTPFRLSLPDGETWLDGWQTSPAISRDGRRIVFALSRGPRNQLHVLELQSMEWRPLPGTDDARGPVFSPDGRHLAFVQSRRLMKVSLDGGPPSEVCRCEEIEIRGAAWAGDDRIVLGTRDGGLVRVAASGGSPEPITRVQPATESNHRYPIMLPGGRHVLFTVSPAERPTDEWVAISAIGSNTHVMLLADARNAQYVSGHLVYVKASGEVHALPFDAATQKTTGASVPLRERPGVGDFTGDVALRLADNGTVVFRPYVERRRRLMLADRKGGTTVLTETARGYEGPRVNPAGTRLVFSVETGIQQENLVVCDLPCTAQLTVTDDDSSRFPIWTADGRGIIHTRRVRSEDIYLTEIDAAGRRVSPARQLTHSRNAGPTSVVDRTLLFGVQGDKDGFDLWTLNLDSPADQRPLIQRANFQYGGQVSPSRRWLAFASDEGAQNAFEVYVTAYPTPGRIERVSRAGGTSVMWSQTEDELFFLQGDRLFAQRFTANGQAPTAPVPAGVVPFLPGVPGNPNYAVLRDGTFVVVVEEPEPADARTPIVILNWASQFRPSK